MLFHQSEPLRAQSKTRGADTGAMVPILEMTQVDIKRAGETWKEGILKIDDLHPRGHQIKGPNPYSKRTNINLKPQKATIREDTDRSNPNASF